jgi:hypothetical protein
MAKKRPTQTGMGLPMAAMLLMAFLGAIVVGGSFEIIKHWPLPASITPYMGFSGGAWWGLVVGAISGWVLGFLTDENSFVKPK